PVRIGATDIDDSEVAVDVATVEPEQLRRSEACRSREDHHQPVHRPELRGHGFDLTPGLKRPLLASSARRVGGASRSRVVVGQPPADGAVEYLAERLRRLKAVPSGTLKRHAYTSRGVSSASRFSPSSAVALLSSQRSFAIVTGAA